MGRIEGEAGSRASASSSMGNTSSGISPSGSGSSAMISEVLISHSSCSLAKIRSLISTPPSVSNSLTVDIMP